MSENPAASLPGQTRRPENLALAFQEILTVIERLRSNRQPIPDAATFRYQFREALKLADAEARRRGYTAEEIQLAIFAVVAFLDESILNLRSPIFADWPRQPLQEEFFGHHIAGEVFFQHLQRLLGANENHTTADVLEVFYLCLLLGFAGRYSIGGRGELRALMDQTAEKIRRIRKTPPDLSPRWRIPPEAVQLSGADPLVKRFLVGAVASLALALALFTTYKIVLSAGVSTLGTVAVEGRR
jgi:type VI secretion system protein ImpK